MAKFYANYVSGFPDIKKHTFVMAVVASSLITYFAYSYLLVRLTFSYKSRNFTSSKEGSLTEVELGTDRNKVINQV